MTGYPKPNTTVRVFLRVRPSGMVLPGSTLGRCLHPRVGQQRRVGRAGGQPRGNIQLTDAQPRRNAMRGREATPFNPLGARTTRRSDVSWAVTGKTQKTLARSVEQQQAAPDSRQSATAPQPTRSFNKTRQIRKKSSQPGFVLPVRLST
eukprot:2724768-Rhodomonas_salina.2